LFIALILQHKTKPTLYSTLKVCYSHCHMTVVPKTVLTSNQSFKQ